MRPKDIQPGGTFTELPREREANHESQLTIVNHRTEVLKRSDPNFNKLTISAVRYSILN
jgi:hypothetical protein